MPFAPTPDEIADRYADSRLRVVTLAEKLGADDLGRTVPGTPEWTVVELLSHLVGCGLDLAAGRVDGAGSPEWTQAQVDARRGRPIDELLGEWDDGYASIDAGIRAGSIPTPVTFDVIIHEQDLRGAVGAEPVSDPQALSFVLDGFGGMAAGRAVKAGLPPLELRDDASGWRVGESGGVCWQGSQLELFRALAGRRSAGQVCAMSWTGDPTAYLDQLSPFGPLPESDVSE
jgi:uncharacterized protein (TIGR03083 family)